VLIEDVKAEDTQGVKALMASADEYHQTFLPNRTGSPWDVLLDCCGAIVLLLAAYVFMRLVRPKKLARAPYAAV
jgi:VanZ family protein